ncbi:MAG: DUF3891 family protein [Planctomycetota bacterium]|nr:MAG: DUF3891 family protein [Planctomycetota bacterium]REK28003.1 MAG: DUF3891 family protein [Planctomycetota bacterium]
MTIRRTATDPHGRPTWVLISQVEHARISGELATRWHEDVFVSPSARAQLVATAYHHDDGWLAWEEAPGVDPDEARPTSFTEMRLTDSLPIWRASIERCAEFGPLAAATTAAHFVFLLRQSDAASRGADDAVMAEQWLAEFEARIGQWRRQWQQQATVNTATAADEALILLQLWDRMSLWLCCAAQHEPLELATAHEPLKMIPLSHDETQPLEVALAPWPLTVDVLETSVPGRAIPVGQYADAEALAGAAPRSVEVCWRLHPVGV